MNEIVMTKRERIVEVLLKIGIAVAFIYPPVEAFFFPLSWIGFFPLWMRDLPIDDTILLHLFGASEIIIALWILFARRILIPSVLASLYLFLIIALNWKYIDLLFRDISILVIPLALAVNSYYREYKN